ncbi:MAG: 4Fe-4S binding protein [Pseudomonadota bacterium]
MTKKLLLCDCLGSQSIDAAAISKNDGLACSKIYTSLCLDQLDQAAAEIAEGGVIVACQQERARFEELAADIEADVAGFVDLRDRAGWGEGDASAKMAALAAEAALELPIGKTVDVTSEGTCLIIGGSVALQAASDLCDTLAVTVLLDNPEDIPTGRKFDCVIGHIKKVRGALGGFTVSFNDFQQIVPGGRGAFALTNPQDGVVSDCDIVLDLSGGTAFVQAPDKREGYLRADPAHPPSVARAIFEASQLVGTFEKPLYVRLEESLCAHSRAEQPACSNCLNICPTGAITSAGEHVAVDPMICAGCGACSAVCPSGAISYDAPPVDALFRRLNTLATAYRAAGGETPVLLVHDPVHGREMISLAARFARGLPAHVIPLEVDALAGFGHAEMLAALACGFQHVAVLLAPTTERDAIDTQLELARAIAGTEVLALLDIADPETLCDVLYEGVTGSPVEKPILPLGNRRQVTRLAAKALRPEAEVIDLPAGAPYGALEIDTDACTLCLACVSLCPSGALIDNEDKPQLRFQEDACLQCGLCTNVCPENALTLAPQLNLTDDALGQTVINEEEPFACIECGALFGTKSTVEMILEKLGGKHSMFASTQAARMIQMCDNCRVQTQFHSQNNPFTVGEPRRPRTTDDYLSRRKDH